MDISVFEIIIIVVLLLSIGAIVFIYFKLQQAQKSYHELLSGVRKGNLEDILKQHLTRIETIDKKLTANEENLYRFKDVAKNYIQKVGFKRFNPFHETGGDQSFVLVLLDDHNSGIVLSSYHQRDVTRFYAKYVVRGKPEHKLSKEEEEELHNTM